MIPLSGQQFLDKQLAAFDDNVYQKILPLTFRELIADIRATFPALRSLNTNQVRGALFRVPYVVLVGGVATVDTNLIPADRRILGMDVRAVHGTDAGSVQAGVAADPIDFRLLAYSAGSIDALVDEQEATTATIKARWVRTSGTEEEKLATFEWLELEDRAYAAGDVVKHPFPNGAIRLLMWRAASVGNQHPVPTGLDSDPIYAPFALPDAGTGAGYTDAQARAAQLNQVAPAGTTTLTFTASQDYRTLFNGTYALDATGAVVGVVAFAKLAPGVAALAIPTGSGYDVIGTHKVGKTNLYAFRVMEDGRILVTISGY